MNCRQADIIGYSIFLEIFLEMRFLIAFGVPEKSVFTRLFGTLQKLATANFQDRLGLSPNIALLLYHANMTLSRPKSKSIASLLLCFRHTTQKSKKPSDFGKG